MLDPDLLERVTELRAAGLSPKQIARTLGVRPATVAPLVRAVAARSAAEQPEAAVLGCWVSPGWSSGLTVHGHPEWPDVPESDAGPGGVAIVAVARRQRSHRVSVCGYLVDTYCLGVKDALGPRVMSDSELPGFLRLYFGAFAEVDGPLQVPLELARHLVCGAVDAARRLGFEPAADFVSAAGHLGLWAQDSAITFGRDGVPFYIQGPYDDADAVVRTLTRTVGADNFHFILCAEPTAAFADF